jgi:GT2 family glycosyltransferase
LADGFGVSRLPLSVIVAASGTADAFHAFLELLGPTLAAGDEAVCVVPPDRADLRPGLSARPWIRVLDETADDPAGRWAAGLAATTHPVAVLVDGDILLSPHWLDAVAEALADPTVVAAGPRCQRGAGPQRADLPVEALSSAEAFRAYAERQWRERRGEVTESDRLGPICVAVRRDALARAGGPGFELPWPRLAEHGRMVVADAAVVVHEASVDCGLRTAVPADAPLLSASLIVRDEEAIIAECLDALRDLADEIVVYDTGSTDRTREIAREHGARVIEGYWNDHFADARNRSLAHCRGQWVLWVDADEVATGDFAAVRAHLAAATDQVAFLVTIQNLTETGHDSFPARRLFRGGDSGYAGRLHEQVVDRVTGNNLVCVDTVGLTLVHHGYTLASVAGKGKVERNHRLATLAARDAVSDEDALVNLARSQALTGDGQAVMDTCRAGLARYRTPLIRSKLLDLLIQVFTQTDRLAEANEALAELRTVAQSKVTVDQAEVMVRFAEGNDERVLEVLADFPESALHDAGMTVGRRNVVNYEICALLRTGRAAQAAELLRTCLRAGELTLALPDAVAVLEEAGSGVPELVELLPAGSVQTLLHSATRTPAPVAAAIAEALWQRYPGDRRVLSFAAWLGPRLPVMHALEWSVRLRQHGFAEQCPLLAIAAAPQRVGRDRVLAAGVAAEMFGDPAALPRLAEGFARLTAAEAGPVLDELRLLAPTIAATLEPTPAR